MATKVETIHKMLQLCGLKPGKKFYELGSGDGRVVYEAALLGAEAVGIEQSILRVWYSRFTAAKMNLKNTHFIHGNVFRQNYSDASVIYIYLLQPAIDRLEEKLKEELKPGVIVITQTYHFKKWKPFQKIDVIGFNNRKTEVWLYMK